VDGAVDVVQRLAVIEVDGVVDVEVRSDRLADRDHGREVHVLEVPLAEGHDDRLVRVGAGLQNATDRLVAVDVETSDRVLGALRRGEERSHVRQHGSALLDVGQPLGEASVVQHLGVDHEAGLPAGEQLGNVLHQQERRVGQGVSGGAG